MSRNNSPAHVLVTEGNQAVLAADTTVDALSPGQIGVFDADTGVSLDNTSARKNNIFIAVGLDRDGDTVLDDIVQSAGQLIQTKNLKEYNFREHTAAQPMIGVIADYVGECDTDYAIKIEFRNQQIYRTQGFNQFTKTYAFRTDCCEECETCPSGDANEVTQKLLQAIAVDADGLLVAKAVTRQAVTIATHSVSADLAEGADISDADIEALKVFNALDTTADADKVYTDVVIETVPLKVNKFCSINLKYFHPRGTVVLVSMVDGFNCKGSFTETQSVAFEEGNGYDIAQKEFHAAGVQQNRPYAVSESTNMPIEFDSFAVKTEKYDQFTLGYDQESQGGWLEYKNDLRTIIAIPNQDTVTRNALVAVLDAQFATTAMGYDALADDVAASDVSDTAVDPTSGRDDVDADGISS